MTRIKVIENLAELIVQIRLIHPVRVAIDGIDCAGKTSLADELVEPVKNLGREIIRASIDSFHNPREVRYSRGKDSPEGYYFDSFNYAELKKSLLEPLGPDGNRMYVRERFDFRTDEAVTVDPKTADKNTVLLFDGVFLQRPELDGCFDFAVFVDIDFDECIRRAVRRDREYMGDVSEVERRYRTRYIPGQKLYIAEADPISKADVVVRNDDWENPELLTT